jgi:ribosome-binding factor A
MSERMRRVNESVRAVVADAVGSLKDPRIGLVTVTAVRVTPDLREATVFVSVLGGQRRRRETLAGLESAHGVLQARINRELNLRRTPTLAFSYDDSSERGVEMSRLIDELTAELPERDEEDDADNSD